MEKWWRKFVENFILILSSVSCLASLWNDMLYEIIAWSQAQHAGGKCTFIWYFCHKSCVLCAKHITLNPKFYIQTVYKPHSSWVPLFGLFGQFRAVRKKKNQFKYFIAAFEAWFFNFSWAIFFFKTLQPPH